MQRILYIATIAAVMAMVALAPALAGGKSDAPGQTRHATATVAEYEYTPPEEEYQGTFGEHWECYPNFQGPVPPGHLKHGDKFCF